MLKSGENSFYSTEGESGCMTKNIPVYFISAEVGYANRNRPIIIGIRGQWPCKRAAGMVE